MRLKNQNMLNSIPEAIEAIRNGELIIVVDDEDRENEGDFIGAAELITPEKVNFMATVGRGLICTPLEADRVEALGLDMMVNQNTAMHETAFTVSIDLIGHGCTTGISAYDRATGIKALTDPKITGNDYAKPGHIFPLRAKAGGVLRRTGHTEAAVDLARMAGLYPAGVLVEILNPDGSMARLPQLMEIAESHQLKIVSINDLVAYRLQTEKLVRKEFEGPVESPFGQVIVHIYRQVNSDDVHIALQYGQWNEGDVVPVRVFSENKMHETAAFLFTGWGKQLESVMNYFKNTGKGLALFMRQAERAADLVESIANLSRGIKAEQRPEQRDLGIGAQIIRDMGITKMDLVTGSATRRIGILGYGIEIVQTTGLESI